MSRRDKIAGFEQCCYNRRMKKTLLRLSAICFGALLCTSAFAAPKWYQVEIIIFKNKTEQALNQEKWPSYPALPTLDDAVELVPPQNKSYYKPYELLPKSAFILKTEESRIERNPEYQILLHQAWLQKFSEGLPIHISADATDPANPWQLNGTIRLSLHKYIHLEANLSLDVPTADLPQQDKSEQPIFSRKIANFRMIQQRKLRSKELHYLDNPHLGVLVKIIPYS